MIRALKIIGMGWAAVEIWAVVLVAGELDGWWQKPVALNNDTARFLIAVGGGTVVFLVAGIIGWRMTR